MLKTTAMLENTETMTVNYPYLDDFFKEFKEVKFKKITKEQYDEMMTNIAKVSEYGRFNELKYDDSGNLK